MIATQQTPTAYHWILTVKLKSTISTRAGVWTPPHPADARRDVALRAIAEDAFPGLMPNIVVLFFSFEPNQL